jgi:hypothetical protein
LLREVIEKRQKKRYKPCIIVTSKCVFPSFVTVLPVGNRFVTVKKRAFQLYIPIVPAPFRQIAKIAAKLLKLARYIVQALFRLAFDKRGAIADIERMRELRVAGAYCLKK